jgi:phospholipid-binding lipoprotein MlaA
MTALTRIFALLACLSLASPVWAMDPLRAPASQTNAGGRAGYDTEDFGPEPAAQRIYDPVEPVNRGIFGFNYMLDGVLLKPLAHIYLGIVPTPAQNGLRNALGNLTSPIVLLNSVLQGDMDNAGTTVERFVINSTLGLAGLFDVASDFGIEKMRSKDFGQTMGVYGVKPGPYVVIPVLGSSNTRDTVGLVVDFLSDPLTYVLTTDETIALDVTRTLVKRADYLSLTDDMERNSFDLYATYRSVYSQRRAKVIRDYLKPDIPLAKQNGLQ